MPQKIDPEQRHALSDLPLDPVQIARIEAVHRGFLYQHLYATACLLTVARIPNNSIIVEMDEDIEVVSGSEKHYLQIKTRSKLLQLTDIAGILDRFNKLRTEHNEGRRFGNPTFAIISNAELTAKLTLMIESEDWPNDVSIITPTSTGITALPPAWPNIELALKWCIKRANNIPFGSLSPETLVWKLAARVQYAASGAQNHKFDSESMPGLLEQFVLQLQDFPEPPTNYRPQVNEPSLFEESTVRILTGFSGAGKTSWASQAAMHCPNPVTYFNIGNMPPESAANALARELTARFIGASGGTIFAENAGIEILRAATRLLKEKQVNVTVVLDNVHRLSSSAILAIVEAAPNIKFILIAQPWPEQRLIEAYFQIKAEHLEGWSLDSIAEEAEEKNCSISVSTAEKIKRITGGLPLYVQGAFIIISTNYGGNSAAFCDAIASQTHTEITNQELILYQAFYRLSEDARLAAGVLSWSEVPLKNEEVLALMNIAFGNQMKGPLALRELKLYSFVVNLQKGQIGLHDALLPLAYTSRTSVEPELEKSLLQCLTSLISVSLAEERNIPRLNFVIKLLPRIGEVDALVDLATNEMFYEQGDQTSLKIELENATKNQTSSISDRYWANDALAYWESRDGGQPSSDRLAEMHRLIKDGNLGEREKLGLWFKELIAEASKGNHKGVEQIFDTAKRLVKQGSLHSRLLRYNYCVANYRLGNFNKVLTMLESLINEYYLLLGINEGMVSMKGTKELHDILLQPVDIDSVKRLGDALSLWSITRVALNLSPVLRRLYSMKFYNIAYAGRSAAMAAMEATQDFLDFIADPVTAKQTMDDHVFPLIMQFQLTDMLVEARSLYAIVLAWCGEGKKARQELDTISNYDTDDFQINKIAESRVKVESIIAGKIRLIKQSPPQNFS